MKFSSYDEYLRFLHGTEECPFCHNEIESEADYCEHCERDLKDEDFDDSAPVQIINHKHYAGLNRLGV